VRRPLTVRVGASSRSQGRAADRLERPRALEPGLKLFPVVVVQADLAAAAAFAAAHEQRSAPLVESASPIARASWVRKPARERTTMSARSRAACRPVPACRITATISAIVGGFAG
jgi:hypothetical protein